MRKLSKQMENWRQAELRHAAVFGKPALRTRGYQKIRLAEMQRIYENHRGVKLSLEDKVRLRLLRAGNRHLEKQLYPNRLIRYARRVVRFSERIVTRGYKQLRKIMDSTPSANKQTIIAKKPLSPLKPIQHDVVKQRVVRLPRKAHQPVEELMQKQGRSL